MSDLLPCPVCGSKPREIDGTSEVTRTGKVFFVTCTCEDCPVTPYQWAESRAKVADRWNKRHVPPAERFQRGQQLSKHQLSAS